VVKLSPEAFDSVCSAIDKANKLAVAIMRAKEEAEKVVRDAMVRAGLDPRYKYKMNPDGLTAVLVVE
jgi:hypothetical protein